MSKLSRNDKAVTKQEQVPLSDEENVAVYTKKQRCRREYVWMNNIFPIEIPPVVWKNLVDQPASAFSTPAPAPLPEVCPNQFKHEWSDDSCRFTDELTENDVISPSKRLKLLCRNNTAYWFYPANDTDVNNSGQNVQQNGYRVVVWLEDGSTLRTHPTNLFYLAHRQYNLPATERVYSPTHLPQDPYLKSVILRATRLLSACLHCGSGDSIQSSKKQCWEFQRTRPQSGNKCSEVFETVVVPGLGRFSVADGSIQIRFDSGVTLHSSINDSLFQQMVAHGSR